jgi:hypothetical protein
MEKRREKGIQYKDLLGYVVEDAPNNIAQIATDLSWLDICPTKYLHDYPQVRESIKMKNSNSCFEKIIFVKYHFTNFTH